MNNISKFSRYLIILIVILSIFGLAITTPTDPDLGFHIRVGERLWQEKSLPQSVWFNHSFLDGNWQPHEAISEVLIYFTYATWGFLGLSIVFTLIMLLIAYLLFVKLRDQKVSWYVHIPIAFLAFITLQMHAGVRLQILMWLGLIIAYLAYFAWKKGKPWPIWWWLIISLVWANLHNSLLFIMAIIFVLMILNLIFSFASSGSERALSNNYSSNLSFPRKWESSSWIPDPSFAKASAGRQVGDDIIRNNLTKPSWTYWLKVLIIMAIASFLQPLGWQAHLEFWNHLTDSYKVNISEWQPANITHQSGMMLILSFTLFFVSLLFVQPKQVLKLDLALLIVAVLLMLSGFMNLRNIPLALIALVPIFSQTISLIMTDFEPSMAKSKIAAFILIVLATLMVFATIIKTADTIQKTLNYQKLADAGGYPYQAVQYLKDNKIPSGKVLNDYGWGGFLIFNLPDVDWFMDGRFPHMRVIDPLNPEKEKITTLKAYNQLVHLEEKPEELLKYYDISWTFLRKKAVINQYLISKGWKVVYEDGRTMILEKP